MPNRCFLLRCGLLLAVASIVIPPEAARAQQFSAGNDDGAPVQALSFGITAVDFRYDGRGTPRTSFAFEGPAYGVVYTRPNLHLALAFGAQAGRDAGGDPRTLRLVDAALTTWGAFLQPRRKAATRFYVPVALHTGYRRVSPEGEENSLTESFNTTVVGLGAGVGLAQRLGRQGRLAARATPIVGLATRAFGDGVGTSYLLDGDVQLDLGPVARRYGLTLGYGFRYQVWNGGKSGLLGEVTRDLFDYRGLQHSFRAGIGW